MQIFDEFLSEVREDVDRSLNQLIPHPEIEPVRLHEAIRWSVFAGGKRIRPAIVYAVGRSFGVEPRMLDTSAAAVEMIHTYSLIHDDLPAMDDDDLRRGRATCHKQFGEATAILAGDVLQTLAFKAIADDNGLDPKTRVQLISILAEASGTPSGMVAGQQLDLEAEGRSASHDEIERIHHQKTGALITASARCGAIIGEATHDELLAIGRFTFKLGLLFQITDDLLDVTQETEMLGKTAGKDASVQKATYPGHFGIKRTREMAETVLNEALAALAGFDRDKSLLSELANAVANRTR